MSRHELLRLADLALVGHISPQLPQEVLRTVVELTRARAGVLLCANEAVAHWPAAEATAGGEGGWTEIPFGADGSNWVARLAQPEVVDDTVLLTARLALRAWDLKEELRRSRFDERFRLWELEAVRSIATSVGGILEPGRLAEELIAHLVALLGVRSAQLFLGSAPASATCVASFGPPVLERDDLEAAWRDVRRGEEALSLPLQARHGTLGVLAAGHKEARSGTEPFSAHDLRLMELFAVQATIALETARLTQESLERERLRRELEVAAVIQSHLYPSGFPEFSGFRLAARSRSSRQVCGDSFDVVVHSGTLLASVADVSGKGVGAGMLASGIHAGVRLLAREGVALDEMGCRLNAYLSGVTAANRFATMVMLRVGQDGGFATVGAGHPPVLVRRRSGRVDQIPSSGLPLGIMDEASYVEARGRLEPGEVAVLYTDGLTEAESPDEEELGVDRLAEALAGLPPGGAEAVCEGLFAAVDSFTGGAVLLDDATLLVLERLGVA